jgi:hypothetical protein
MGAEIRDSDLEYADQNTSYVLYLEDGKCLNEVSPKGR